MSDALPLRSQPRLGDYERAAKDFQSACKSSDAGAIREWAKHFLTPIAPNLERQVDVEVARIDHHWRTLEKRCSLPNARFFVAREHGFSCWRRFVSHLEALVVADSAVSNLEAAVDAIVRGDLDTLSKLLRGNPKLVRARSTREHRSTLLHYVSANGVEDFRQKTPKNIVEITRLLLDAGADVNAESDAYGGRSTTLGLTATSWHPENAGVQLELMGLLIERGAIIDGPDGGSAVNGCLHNGRGLAAEFLAARGARLDLEGAAGVGRLDVVTSFFDETGALTSAATRQQMNDGFAWACQFGRTGVVDFLLQRGMDLNAKLKHDGETGLHWAACGGHPDTVKLLLQHGAPPDAKDERYGGTPLGWALYSWGNASKNAENYPEVVALLVRSGAKLDHEWYEADEERRRAYRRMQADPQMLTALRGETSEHSP